MGAGRQLQAIPLWDAAAPGARGAAAHDVPTLTPVLPEDGTGAALVICPGGGYEFRSDFEGLGYARWLAQHGVAGLVLDYRLGSNGYRHSEIYQDAARALRFARFHAGHWGLDTRRIGIIGSSAGGHLASMLLTRFDAGDLQAADPVEHWSSRPDLGVLCYPVITMGAETHEGSRDSLLGTNAGEDLKQLTSSERQVTKNTPPCFIWHTLEDELVNVSNAMAFAEALRDRRVPYELHIYEKGAHGMGLGESTGGEWHRWTADCLAWLRERGYAR